MKLDFNEELPIYLQLCGQIEDGILSGIYGEGEQIPSTTEIAVTCKVNPATVAKGYNRLVDEGIIVKKRGVGMFVKEGAVNTLRAKRKEEFFSRFILAMLEEGRRLGLTKQDLILMIEEAKENE